MSDPASVGTAIATVLGSVAGIEILIAVAFVLYFYHQLPSKTLKKETIKKIQLQSSVVNNRSNNSSNVSHQQYSSLEMPLTGEV